MIHSVREDAYITVEYGYENKLKQLEEERKIKLLTRQKVVKYAQEAASNYNYTVPYSFILVYQIIKHD